MSFSQELSNDATDYPVEESSGYTYGNDLRPVTSVATNRYYKNAQVPLAHCTVAPGLGRFGQEEMPVYLPEHWSTYVQPEGQLYFCRHTQPTVITEAYLYDPENMRRLTYWLTVIERAVDEKDIIITEHVELFIQLEDSGCAYYFIDHQARTEFWLDPVVTETLGLPQVASEGHLKMALTEHYWAHVEFFPSHFPGFPASVFDELTSILAHAKLDRLTSSLSTVPYSADECTNYIKLLQSTRGNANPCSTCLVARIWMLISSHRFTTLYGQESSRLSRTQSILALPTYSNNLISKVMTRTSLGLSDLYKHKLEGIFVDDIVYIDQWHKFIKSCMDDWKMSSQISTTLLLAHAIYCMTPCIRPVAFISGFTLFASVLSAILLNIQHRQLQDTTANLAADHLLAIRSTKYGFHLPGFIFALPSVLCIFGTALFIAHGLSILALNVHLGVAVGLAAFIALFSLAIRRALSPRAAQYTPSEDITGKCEV